MGALKSVEECPWLDHVSTDRDNNNGAGVIARGLLIYIHGVKTLVPLLSQAVSLGLCGLYAKTFEL